MKTNHRRKRKTDRDLRKEVGHVSNRYIHGFEDTEAIWTRNRNGGYTREHNKNLDKSDSGYGVLDEFTDRLMFASVGHHFSNGRRGMAKAVRGAKKYVRTRTRFHGKMKLNRMVKDGIEE